MANEVYEKGKVKVVWVERDPQKIYSKMFNEEKEAEDFAKSKDDYVIFALESQKDMREFSWKLLPYGKYNLYTKLVTALHINKSNILKHVKDLLPS